MFTSSMFSPTTVGDPAEWLVAAMGGGSRAAAGVMVSERTAMGFSAVQACVTLLSETMAQLPCNIYERQGEDRRLATDHELYEILHHQPNSWQTSFDYFEQGMGALGMRGNAYRFVRWDNRGRIRELLPIHNDQIEVWRNADGTPRYFYKEIREYIPLRNMHHIRGLAMNGYTGVSPIQSNKDTVGLALATEQHASSVFRNGTHLSGTLNRPQGSPRLGPKAVRKIKETFKSEHTGNANAFGVAVLQDGMTYQNIGMTNADAQLLASRGYGVVEVCRLYKVPPHMVQHLESAHYNNVEQQNLQFLIFTMMSWIRRHEMAMRRDLLTPEERERFYIEFNVAGLMRGDMASRYAAYVQGRQWGWLSVNDIRRFENLPPIAGGDVYLQPMNMQDIRTPFPLPGTETPGGVPGRQGQGQDVTKEQVKQLTEECQL